MGKKFGFLILALLFFAGSVFACVFSDYSEAPTTYINADNFYPKTGQEFKVQMIVCNHTLSTITHVSAGSISFGENSRVAILSSPTGFVSINSKEYFIFEWTVKINNAGTIAINGFSNIGDGTQPASGMSVSVSEPDSTSRTMEMRLKQTIAGTIMKTLMIITIIPL